MDKLNCENLDKLNIRKHQIQAMKARQSLQEPYEVNREQKARYSDSKPLFDALWDVLEAPKSRLRKMKPKIEGSFAKSVFSFLGEGSRGSD